MYYSIINKIRKTKPKTEKEKLIYDNILLVQSFIRKRKGLIDEENVLMDGIEALTEAANKYKKSSNAKFSTYAYTVIKRKLDCSDIEDGKCVSLPRYAKEAILKIRKILAMNPDITIDDINLNDYEIRGVKRDETLQAIKNVYIGMFNTLSLYEKNDKDDEREVPEAQSPVDEAYIVDNKVMYNKIKAIIEKLPDRQKEVMMRRYFDENKDYTPRLAEVAQEMGLFRQSVFKAEQKAISRIQRIYKEK